ncbi:MAG: hypothetical protein ACRD3T_18970 [Terriglobia bacterium]
MSEKLMRAAAPLCAALMVVAMATSCRNLNTKPAVQAAIEKHLQQNSSIDRSNFTTEIETVSFKGDTANALVKFQSKRAPSLAVHVRYQLKRSGSRWIVMSSEPAGGQGMDSHIGSESSGSESAAPRPDSSGPAPVASH